jgi:hypothetical protein
MDSYKGLPLADLLAAPLVAAVEAQNQLAGTTAKFIKDIGCKIEDNKLIINNIEITHSHPVYKDDGTIQMVKSDIHIPLLTMVNVPALSIKRLKIEFVMDVKNATKDSKEVKGDLNVKIGSPAFYPITANITGSIAASTNTQRSTDTASKYMIQLEAEDTGPPEGLSKLMEILNNGIPNSNQIKYQSSK